jgi:phosphoenolpyruvate-protein kinase (PTS system EI component)
MERALSGLSAAPGNATGRACVLAAATVLDREPIPRSGRQGEVAVARAALDRAAAEIEAIAARLRESGQDEEAEIVETGALIAQDPLLQREVLAAVFDDGLPAAAAILDVSDAHADSVAALDDPRLAERADDIRSVGRRSAGLVGAGSGSKHNGASNGAGEILVASDLGPAEVAELEAGVAGIALAAGGVSAHAAIMARSLGIPMVVGVGDGLLTVAPGSPLVVDGSSGTVFLSPQPERIEAALLDLDRRAEKRAQAIAARELPSVTVDGHPVRVLANVSGTAELAIALEAGAEGVGLLRTELAFLTAPDWPSEDDHRRLLAPILAQLRGRLATVRVLDFGGDKTPPFLAGVEERGIELLLNHPDPFAAQLRAIVATAAGSELRILLPMVGTVGQVYLAREAMLAAVDAVPGASRPRIGAMIETSQGVDSARAIAAEVDFLSIGTNDLTHSILRADRYTPHAARAHNPRVLRAIATVVQAAQRAGVALEVCGEAASDPISAPLLVGSGVDEISVGAARVGTVRQWVRSLSFAELSELEVTARRLETPTQVETLVADIADQLVLMERADANGEALEGPIGVGALGAEAKRRSTPGA